MRKYQDVKNFASGNGEIVAVKDVTEDYPISCSKVADALINANFGNVEIDFILRLLNSQNFLVD